MNSDAVPRVERRPYQKFDVNVRPSAIDGHGVFAGTILINVLLPLVHPRMGSAMSDATEASLIEAPGFLGLNYGPQTASVGLFAHVMFGITIAAFVNGSG